MIPLFRNSLSRIDLSSVLENMVENCIDGNSSGQEFAIKIANLLGFAGGISVRNTADAFSCSVDMLRNYLLSTKKNGEKKMPLESQPLILLPITVPQKIVFALQRMNYALYFYDVKEDGISPSINESSLSEFLLHNTYNPIIATNIFNFGTSATHNIVLPSSFDDFSKITLGYTIPCKNKEENSSLLKDNQDTVEKMSEISSDFFILVMEENPFITSASGAVLSMKDKKLLKYSKIIEAYYYLLSDFNAALAHSQLKQLPWFTKKSTAIKNHYIEAIRKSKYLLPESMLEADIIPQSFPIIAGSKIKESMKFIQKQKIECDLLYKNSYLQYLLSSSNKKEIYINSYPNATKLLQETMIIPLYASLSNDEISHISKVIASLP